MNDFDQLIQDIEAEAVAEGPAAVAQLRGFDQNFVLAAEIIALRKAKGLTQNALADLSGVQQADISKIERGVSNPTWQTLGKIASALGGRLGIVAPDQRTAGA